LSQSINHIDQLLSLIDDGALVLTVNKRLARYIQKLYDNNQLKKNLLTWQSPDIYMISTWMSLLFQKFSDIPVLSQEQSHYIWSRIVADNVDKLLHLHAATSRVQDAYKIIHDYLIPLSKDELFTEESEKFFAWKSSFEDLCHKQNVIPAEKISKEVIKALQAGLIQSPSKVIFCGFDEITPVEKSLIETLGANGSQLFFWEPQIISDQTPKLIQSPCPEDEVALLARWVRNLLDQGKENIAVVVPELNFYRPLIERAFGQELVPESVLPGSYAQMPFNISLGIPLNTIGPIAIALEALGSNPHDIPLEAASLLLRSPYLGKSWDELNERAFLDLKLRELNKLTISFKEIINLSKKLDKAKSFSLLLQSFAELKKHEPSKAYASSWARHFSKLLACLGWPGPRTIDSTEYQAISSWHEVLDTFISMDTVASPMSFSDAASHLKWSGSSHIFQPETLHARVEIMGILEASGMTFDHLWLLGMREDALPESVNPNPFLPITMQKTFGVPRSSVEKELEFSRRVMQRLFINSPHTIASYPKQREGQDTSPSRLMKEFNFEETALEKFPDHSLVSCLMREREPIESIQDFQITPSKDAVVVSGGTEILKNQALCPFKAYALHRLKASMPEIAESGLSAKERGIIIHTALETVWKKLKDSSRLAEKEYVEQIVKQAVKEVFDQRFKDPTESRYISIEKDRTKDLLMEWFNMETARPEFKVISTEARDTISIGDLSLRIKIDRIDELDKGKFLVIDYKTGNVSKGDLMKDRLTEPQLPLYALKTKNVEALAFAKIKPGECKFTGFMSESDISIPGIDTQKDKTWEDILRQWDTKLNILAKEFMEGLAEAAPEDAENTCRTCSLQPLCRIYDAR
jgi:probable DNA repair protein